MREEVAKLKQEKESLRERLAEIRDQSRELMKTHEKVIELQKLTHNYQHANAELVRWTDLEKAKRLYLAAQTPKKAMQFSAGSSKLVIPPSRKKRLKDHGLVAPRPTKTPGPLFSSWLNPHLTCLYHERVLGHSIESCIQFKKLVLSMVDEGMLHTHGSIVRERRQVEIINKLREYGNSVNANLREYLFELRRKELQMREENFQLKAQV
ncbi:anthranilate synthase alpha [Senna tora]|uniref:Anthranilate synthase alpha n=1 Tax=Senna tora TaxID=362788 RepID=A0A834X7G7_9FABA|nr:anthranilate synthase alpha [Senna tora]